MNQTKASNLSTFSALMFGKHSAPTSNYKRAAKVTLVGRSCSVMQFPALPAAELSHLPLANYTHSCSHLFAL